MKAKKDLTMPQGLDECEALRLDLVAKQQDIQRQLSEKNRTDKNGSLLTRMEYDSWRQSALFSLTRTNDELRRLKLHVKKLKQIKLAGRKLVGQFSVDPSDPASLLQAAKKIFDELSCDVDLHDDELAVIQMIKDYFRTTPVYGGNYDMPSCRV